MKINSRKRKQWFSNFLWGALVLWLSTSIISNICLIYNWFVS